MTLFLTIYTLLFALCFSAIPLSYKYKRSAYAATKGITSLLFVLMAIICLCLQKVRYTQVSVMLCIAMVLCAIGDITIGLANKGESINKRAFVSGWAAFLLAHIIFCVAFYVLGGAAWHGPVLALISLVAVALLNIFKAVQLKAMFLPGLFYAFFVGFMTGSAINAAINLSLSPVASVLLLIGSVLFWISDLVLLFLYFGKKKTMFLRLINLSTYYAGIYMIAISIYYL